MVFYYCSVLLKAQQSLPWALTLISLSLRGGQDHLYWHLSHLLRVCEYVCECVCVCVYKAGELRCSVFLSGSSICFSLPSSASGCRSLDLQCGRYQWAMWPPLWATASTQLANTHTESRTHLHGHAKMYKIIIHNSDGNKAAKSELSRCEALPALR